MITCTFLIDKLQCEWLSSNQQIRHNFRPIDILQYQWVSSNQITVQIIFFYLLIDKLLGKWSSSNQYIIVHLYFIQ